MTKDLLIPLLRHTLTGLFTALAAKGFVGGNDVDGAVNAVIVLINLGWMIYDKRKANKV